VHWHEKLQDYNFKIIHIPEKNNTPVNALSQPSNDEREVEDRQLLLIPPEVFLNIVDADSVDSLEALLINKQQQYACWLLKEEKVHLEQNLWKTTDQRLMVPPDQELKRWIMHVYHDSLTAHLGHDETVRKVLSRFY